MFAARGLLITVLVLAATGPAFGQSERLGKEIREALQKLDDQDLLEQTYGAIAVGHLARRQWGIALLDGPELRDWQRALAPAVPKLIELLGQDGGLEWVDMNGVTHQTTTPRQEATLALLALERASIEPLLAALDRPPLARKADELLRRVTRGGPTGHDRVAWQQWWAVHQGEPLHNEHGQLWLVLVGLLLAAAGAFAVYRLQRTTKAPAMGLRLGPPDSPAPGPTSS